MVQTPLQQVELYMHDTLSYAYLVAMGMACPLFILFINTRLQFRMAGGAVSKASKLAYHIVNNRRLPLHTWPTKSRTPHRCPDCLVTCPGTISDMAHGHQQKYGLLIFLGDAACRPGMRRGKPMAPMWCACRRPAWREGYEMVLRDVIR